MSKVGEKSSEKSFFSEKYSPLALILLEWKKDTKESNARNAHKKNDWDFEPSMRFAKELVTLNSAMQIKGTAALIVLISDGNSDHVAHVWWVTGNF